jgi:hypothetical protein
LFPPLVGLAREKGEREIHGKSRVVWLRFEFKFESWRNNFDNSPNWFPRVLNTSNKS